MPKFGSVLMVSLVTLTTALPSLADDGNEAGYHARTLDAELGVSARSGSDATARVGAGASVRAFGEVSAQQEPTMAFGSARVGARILVDETGKPGAKGEADLGIYLTSRPVGPCKAYIGPGLQLAGDSLGASAQSIFNGEAGAICRLRRDVLLTLGASGGGGMVASNGLEETTTQKGLRTRLAVGRQAFFDTQVVQGEGSTSLRLSSDVAVNDDWRISGDLLVKRGSIEDSDSGETAADSSRVLTVTASRAF